MRHTVVSHQKEHSLALDTCILDRWASNCHQVTKGFHSLQDYHMHVHDCHCMYSIEYILRRSITSIIVLLLPRFLHSSEQLVCAYGLFALLLSTASMNASLSDFSVNLKLMSPILSSLSTSEFQNASATCLRVSSPVQWLTVPSDINLNVKYVLYDYYSSHILINLTWHFLSGYLLKKSTVCLLVVDPWWTSL